MPALSEAEIDAAFEAASAPKIRICKLGKVLAENPALQPRVMDISKFDSLTVYRVLKGLGFQVSSEVVNKHRKGSCSCTGTPQRGGKRDG